MKVKVIHIISSLRRGGRERQLAGILKSSHTGYQNMAIVFNKNQSSYEQEYNLGSKLFYLHSKNPITRFIEIRMIVRREHPNIIWSWGGFEATFGLLVSLFSSARHVNGSIRHGIVRFNRKQVWRMILLHVSRNIVANSHAGLKANKLKIGKVMYNGLDDHFFTTVDKAIYLHANPDISNITGRGYPIFISVANLVPYKDYFTILKALEHLKNNGFSFNYLIIGEGPDRAKIENDIHQKNLHENVFLLGRRQDVRELLAISDIFIHSSIGEGCSNAILEAMAAGLPVIASDTGGTQEIVTRETGFLFRYQDSSQLADIITGCLEDNSGTRTLGKSAYETAKRKYSIQQMMDTYYKIIEEITSK